MSLSLASRTSLIAPSLIRKLRDAARPTSLDLGLGQTDLAIHEAARDAARQEIDRGLAPYGPNLGEMALRRAVGERYGINASEVMITCGVQEAMAVALLGVIEPGDEVLVPDPGFPAYANLVRFAGGHPVPYRLTAQGQDLDPELILSLLTPRTRAMVINSPGNPTGAVHDPANMLALLRELAGRGVAWISDEIYEDYLYEGAEHVSPADDAELAAHGLRLSGLSKSHHMMGWRVGWLTGPAKLIEGLKPLHQHLVTSAPTLVQGAGVEALRHHQEVSGEARRVFERRREVMIEGLSKIDGVRFERPRGAFYIWMDVHTFLGEARDTLALAMELLEQEDVVTVPGIGFGEAGRDHLRLAYTRDQAILQEALERMTRFFARIG